MIAFLGVGIVAGVGPFAQSGLDEAFSFAVGAGSVRTGEVMPDGELKTGGAEVAAAIAGTVVGEQTANADAMLGVEGDGGAQESDGSCCGLVGEHAREGETRVIVDGDVQSLPAGKLRATTAAAIATNGNALITGHALDVEMKHVAGSGMFVADHGRSRMEIAPAAEPDAPQDAADGSGTETCGLGDLISGAMLTAQGDDFIDQAGASAAGTVSWPGRTVAQTSQAEAAIAADPLSYGFRSDIEAGRGQLQCHSMRYALN